MEYNEIEEMVFNVNEKDEKTGFEFETEYCPKCGSNQYDSDSSFCLTCKQKEIHI